MAKPEKKKILAIDIKRSTVVTGLAGGSRDAFEGDVLSVGTDVSEADAGFLIACKKAVSCAPGLKAERAKGGKLTANELIQKIEDVETRDEWTALTLPGEERKTVLAAITARESAFDLDGE